MENLTSKNCVFHTVKNSNAGCLFKVSDRETSIDRTSEFCEKFYFKKATLNSTICGKAKYEEILTLQF